MKNPHLEELGQFLRARRSELTPSDLGLPEGEPGIRRIAGLRLEKVAARARVFRCEVVQGLWIDRLPCGLARQPQFGLLRCVAGAGQPRGEHGQYGGPCGSDTEVRSHGQPERNGSTPPTALGSPCSALRAAERSYRLRPTNEGLDTCARSLAGSASPQPFLRLRR